MMPRFAMTYVVYWPEAGVLKVGRAWRFHRVQMMTRTGGRILVLARGTDATWEREALRVLRRWFPAAFRNERDALGLLFMGRGWSECFEVDEHHLQLAVDLCFEGFAKGSDQGVNEEAADDQRRRSGVEGVPVGAARGEADRDGAVVAHRRRRPARARAGADRGRPVSRRGGDRDSDRASADARRVGVPADVSGRGFGVARADAAAEGGSSRRCVGVPGTAPRSITEIRGCGGSAGARERAGAGRGGGAGGRVGRVGARAGAHATAGTAPSPRRSAHRMPRPPQRPISRLRSLRHCPPPPRQVGGSAALRRAARRVRGGDER